MSDATRMWRVVRKMDPAITSEDLEQLSGVNLHEAKLFLVGLADAGYLRSRADGSYVLVKDTGPEPPALLQVTAYEDGNTGEIRVASETPEGAAARIAHGLDAQDVYTPVFTFVMGRTRFTLDDAVEASGLDRRKVLRVLERLRKEGVLKLVSDERKPKASRFTGKDMGPRLRNPRFERKDVLVRGNRQPKRDTVRDKLWRVIRRERRFTRPHLAEASGLAEATVRDFVRLLLHHGYIAEAKGSGRAQAYVLIRDVGPVRPITPEFKSKRRKS